MKQVCSMFAIRSILPLFALCLFAGPVFAQKKGTTYEDFLRRYKEAKDLNDPKNLKKVLRELPHHAIEYFKLQVDAFAHRNDQKAADVVEAMRGEFKEAWGSELLFRIERMRATLAPTEVNMVQKLVQQRRQAWKLFEGAKTSKKEREFRMAMEGMQKIAEAFEEIGAKIDAGHSWLLLVNVIEGFPKRNKGDVEQQVMALQRYLELNEDWDWTAHRDYKANKAWLPGLKKRLTDPAAGANPNAKKDSKNAAGLIPYAPDSKWETVKLAHSVSKRPTNGISLYASSNPMYWLGVGLDDTAVKEIPLFKDGKIYLKRAGATKFQSLVKADGKPKNIKLGGVKKPTELWYEKQDADGAYETNYSMFLFTGTRQEEWCGVQLNLEPSWKPAGGSYAAIYRRSASYFTATIAGETVTLYDDNGNGAFGDKAGEVALQDIRLGQGLENPAGHPLMDSMRVGKGPLVPVSPFIKLKAGWFAVRPVRNNEELRFRPLDPAAINEGTVALKWKGPSKARPKHLLIRATSGPFIDAMFDIGSNKKGCPVPAGTYEVYYGRVYNGKAPKNMDCVIFKGDSKSFEVKPGATHAFQMGAPFRIDYTLDRSGKDITVDTTKMWVTDVSGARWTCIASEILEPQLVAAKDNSGKGAKVLHEWRRIAAPTVFNQVSGHYKKNGVALAMFAIDKKGKDMRFEATVKNPFPGPSVVALRQKKHKLFGKLLEVWK